MAPAAAMHPGLFVFDQAMGILDSSAQFRVAWKKLSVKPEQRSVGHLSDSRCG